MDALHSHTHVALQDKEPAITQQIAEYIETARSKLPVPAEREAALKCILDLMAAVIPAINEPGVNAVRHMALGTMGLGNSTIWFCGQSASVIGAAWANSAAASILDLDDGHRLARGHPGAAVIPAAFAIAQETQATFDELISAIVIGYEVGVTIATARKVYGNTGTWSSFAVVAVAAALKKIPRHTIEHALAIAGESAPNQAFASCDLKDPVPEGSHVKEGIPWSVVTGLMALNLAEAGHTGPRNILNSKAHYHFPEVLRLGSQQHICHVYFKLYACCRHIHAPLDAFIDLLDRYDIESHTINKIIVETYSGALRISNRIQPLDLVDIQYSIPYCLALVAINGAKSLLPLTSEALGNEEAHRLAARVQLLPTDEFEVCFPKSTLARVSVVANSRTYISDVTSPLGEATTPLSWETLGEKYQTAVNHTMVLNNMAANNSTAKQLHFGVIKAPEQLRSGNFVGFIEAIT